LIFKNPEENRSWIEAAFEKKSKGLYVEFTASLLKDLNDTIIRDIDLVTALVNLHKEKVFDALDETLKAEGLVSISYSDFKTGRFYIDSKESNLTSLSGKIESAFLKADEDFKQHLQNENLVRRSDLEKQWFHLGLSTQADLSSVAARKAKDKGQTVYSLLDKVELQELEADRQKIVQAFEDLAHQPSLSALFDEEGNLKLKVFEVFRKNKTPKEFFWALKENTGSRISLVQAQAFIDILSDVDVLSPSLIVEERTSVAVQETPFGAFSLDFVGLGAKNLKATLEGVINSANSRQMIDLVRQNEQELTALFNKQKKAVQKIAEMHFYEEREASYIRRSNKESEVTVGFSGDEGIIVPYREVTEKDQLALERKLFNLFGHAQLRMTFIREDSSGALQTDLVSLGENLEKAFKKELLSQISGETLSQIQFHIFIPNVDDPVKAAYLRLYMPQDLPADQKAFLKASYPLVIAKMNASRNEGDPELRPGTEIFALIGND